MKRLWIVALALAFASALALAGCGGGGGGAAGSGDAGGSSLTPKDTGVFTVGVYDGWTAYDVADMFSDDEAPNPETVQIGKGTSSEYDLFTYPYLQITYYKPITTVVKDIEGWYENVKKIDSMTIGTRNWSGFEGDTAGYHWTILFTGEEGEPQFQASLCAGNQEGVTASIDDADVREMIASIKVD